MSAIVVCSKPRSSNSSQRALDDRLARALLLALPQPGWPRHASHSYLRLATSATMQSVAILRGVCDNWPNGPPPREPRRRRRRVTGSAPSPSSSPRSSPSACSSSPAAVLRRLHHAGHRVPAGVWTCSQSASPLRRATPPPSSSRSRTGRCARARGPPRSRRRSARSRDQPHVTAAADPLETEGQVSRDGRIAFAPVQYDQPAEDLAREPGERLEPSRRRWPSAPASRSRATARSSSTPSSRRAGRRAHRHRRGDHRPDARVPLRRGDAADALISGIALAGGILLLTFGTAFADFPSSRRRSG